MTISSQKRKRLSMIFFGITIFFILLGTFFRIRLGQTDDERYVHLISMDVGLFFLLAFAWVGSFALFPNPEKITPLVIVSTFTFSFVLLLTGAWILIRGIAAFFQ